MSWDVSWTIALIIRKLIPDSEFTQLIKGYQGERLRQAFHFFDQDGDGYINPDEFQKIVVVSADV